MQQLRSFFLAALLAFGVPAAHAQSWPTKPVHVIISFTPGSSTDIVGRIVLQKLNDIWGQPVVPDNRAGAGGSIGSAAVAKAAPDGYTLLINSNAHCVNPAIYAKLPYDTLKDFTEIAPLAIQPNVFVVTADSKYKTLMDFVNAARAQPGSLNIGLRSTSEPGRKARMPFAITVRPPFTLPVIMPSIFSPVSSAFSRSSHAAMRFALSRDRRVAPKPSSSASIETLTKSPTLTSTWPASLRNSSTGITLSDFSPALTTTKLSSTLTTSAVMTSPTRISLRLRLSSNSAANDSPPEA